MNRFPKIDMREATRLTREGRLAEAMALLQGAAPARHATTRSAEGERGPTQEQTILDMAPPTKERAWTIPATRQAPKSAATAKQDAGLDRSALRTAFGGKMMDLRNRSPRERLISGARFEERSFANSAGERAYKLYVPSRFTGSVLPLVVMLHGCTQSPDDFAAGTRMNELAEEILFLVAYPAQSQTANVQKCWNWFNAGDQCRDKGEPALIAGITRQVMHDFPVDEGRVYIAGLSAGGAAAAIMGSTYPDLYAAIGVHSGLACGAARDMPSAFSAMRQGGTVGAPRERPVVPTIVFHGDRDTTVSAINGDQVIAQSRAGSKFRVDVQRGAADGGVVYTRTIHSDRENKPVLEQWVLHGAGHAWSGGSAAGSFTDPHGPDASREMMRFFMAHQNNHSQA